MSLEPDFYSNATLINGLPTVTVPPKPYHRKVTNIVVGNGVPSGVNVYRGLLGSVPVAQNTSGANNTVSGVINLPAGQQLFVVWTAVGSPVSSAFARVSFEKTDSPLDEGSADVSAWTVNPVSSITLPTGATSGLRIVLDGSTDTIKMYDAANRLVVQLDPTGIVTGDDLGLGAAANTIRMNVTNNITSNPSLQIQPGATFTGNWRPALLETFLLNAGAANEIQELALGAPGDPNHGLGPAAAIDLTSGAADGSENGHITMFADLYQFQDHNGANTLVDINQVGDVSLNVGKLSYPKNEVAYGLVTAGSVASASNGGPEVAIPQLSWVTEPQCNFQAGRLYKCTLQYGTGLSVNAGITGRVRVRKGSASITGQELASTNVQQQNFTAFLAAPPLVFYVQNATGAAIFTALSVTIQHVTGAVGAIRLYGDAGPGGANGVPLNLTIEDVSNDLAISLFTNLAASIV